MCTREGCFVQMLADNALVEALVKSGPDAKLNIFADGGKSYGLKFSLKGFSAAHDDMVAQARAKAKKPAEAPAAKP
jgi:invasion protein IalB